MTTTQRRVLIVGWFSFDDGHATAGDVLAARTVQDWLEMEGLPYDVADRGVFDGTVDWRTADPSHYDTVVFVCGPFEQKPNEAAFIERFQQCRLVGMNLTLNEPPADWNPFDLLLERDSPTTGRPDLVFGQAPRSVPVCGVCLVEEYPEGDTRTANAAIGALVDTVEVAAIPIDTRLDSNLYGLRSEAEIESVVARVDVIVTTRLHGMVLALKNGVPVVAIDPRPGGGKIVRQAESVGWPIAFRVDRLDPGELRAAFDYCLTDEARTLAANTTAMVGPGLDRIRREFLAGLTEERWPVDGSLRDDSRSRLFTELARPGRARRWPWRHLGRA
jgi:hypothetical protein